MNQKEKTLDLAKLMVASAWADGELSNDEVNALKDLLFTLEDVTAEDWKVLDMYMDSPVSEAETQELLQRVLAGIHGEQDKQFVLDTLRRLFAADGKVTPEETALLNEIEHAVAAVETGILASLTRALKAALGQRTAQTRATALRESNLADYLKNTIYYQLRLEQQRSGISLDLPEDELRKLCLATGLMAHVAQIDSTLSAAEQIAIREIVATDWRLPLQQADLLVRVSCNRALKGLDYFRLTHGYFACTTYEERQAFLKTLFKIANAAKQTSYAEIEEVRRLARSLKLSPTDFVEAKLSVPSKDRGGL